MDRIARPVAVAALTVALALAGAGCGDDEQLPETTDAEIAELDQNVDEGAGELEVDASELDADDVTGDPEEDPDGAGDEGGEEER